MSNTAVEFYTTSSYLEKNPLWHKEESCWKAEHVLRMINRHKIVPRTICGAGRCSSSFSTDSIRSATFSVVISHPRRSNFAGAGLMRDFILSSGMLRKFERGFLM